MSDQRVYTSRGFPWYVVATSIKDAIELYSTTTPAVMNAPPASRWFAVSSNDVVTIDGDDGPTEMTATELLGMGRGLYMGAL